MDPSTPVSLFMQLARVVFIIFTRTVVEATTTTKAITTTKVSDQAPTTLAFSQASTTQATTTTEVTDQASTTSASAQASTTTQVACDSPWLAIDGGCFRTFQGNVDQATARGVCLSLGGDLAWLDSVAQSIGLKSELGETKAYIGLQRIDGIWKWAHSNQTATFINWGVGDPNLESENCANMYYGDGTWANVDCAKNPSSKGYACRKAMSSTTISAVQSTIAGTSETSSVTTSVFPLAISTAIISTTTISPTMPAATSPYETRMQGNELDVATIEGTLIMTVSNASRFLQEPSIANVMKIAIAEMCEADVSWVHVDKISIANDRNRLLGVAGSGDGEQSDFVMSLDDDVTVEFRVVVPANGDAEYISVTVVAGNFDAISVEETNRIINKLIESNFLGMDYEARVTYKEVQVVSTDLPHSGAAKDDSLASGLLLGLCSVSILIAAIAVCCLWFRIRRKRLLRGVKTSRRSFTISSTDTRSYLFEGAGPMGECSYMELLFPPPVISEECHRQLLQSLSCMMCDGADCTADAFVLYADGHRAQDAKNGGPGIFHAAAVVKAFHVQGLNCILPLPGVLDSDDFLTLLRAQETTRKTLIVVETVDLFNCRRCLEALYVAQDLSFDLKRIRMDGTSDCIELRWPCISECDTRAVDMIKTLESGYFFLPSYPAGPTQVLNDPRSLETIAVQISLQTILQAVVV